MSTNSSRLPLPATHRGAGKEALAHISRHESLVMIPPLILELSGRFRRQIGLLEASSGDPAQRSDDLAALAWIQRSLEDVEATLIGLSEVTATVLGRSRVLFLRLPEAWLAKVRLGQPAASIKAPVAHAGGCGSSLPRQGQLACPQYRSPPSE